jgi:hypothetical protein
MDAVCAGELCVAGALVVTAGAVVEVVVPPLGVVLTDVDPDD